MGNFLALWSCLFCFRLTAAEPVVPQLAGPLVDDAAILDTAAITALSSVITKLNADAGIQLAVLMTRLLEGMDIESYSILVAEKWGLGKKGDDKGILFIIAPHEHKARIEVGYGLEGLLTDAFCNRVLDDWVIPYFRKNNYRGGIEVAVALFADKLGVAKTTAFLIPKRTFRARWENWIAMILMGFFFLIFSGLAFFSRAGFLGTFRRRLGGPTNWGHYSRSGGGFGSSGSFGGGFHGGGGGFGGGGASGSW
jgi:uncharacterized protein